jgi:60 kDa SS-A/Ro ribonucleoprotein
VLRDAESAAYVAARLSDAAALRKARILPFRVFMAYRMFAPATGSERLVAEALVTALDATFANMPDLGDGVLIAPDVSGSMRFGGIGRHSRVRYIDIAGILTAALLKASRQALVLPFEQRVVPVRLSARDSAMTTADKLAAVGGGGTAVSAPISALLHKRIAVDTFIGITDNVEWATDQTGGSGFLPTWRRYRREVAPDAQAFLVTIAPYRHAVAPTDEPGVFYLYGWSEQVLGYISLMRRNRSRQVAAVRQMML